MSQLSAAHLGVGEKPHRRRSPSPSPNRKNKKKAIVQQQQQQQQQQKQSLNEKLDELAAPKNNDIFSLSGSDYNLMIILTILAAVVRLYRIYQPTSVVFDEVHFGGFATKYIKGKFFMDVHPPLAKMLITLAGWLAGFDGGFDFKEIGKDYLEPGVPYVAMRMLPALCGIAVVPTIFLTLKAASCSTATAIMGAGLIIFENALLTQSRLILLDSPLVIFTALTGLAWTSFLNVHELGPEHAFGLNWWFWLATTGLGLGATVSVKWVGLFTIAWVGSLTVIQLWFLLGDVKNVSASSWIKHFFARAFCLIGIPVAFYMAMFAIHFELLKNPGDGDGFMSSEFQATLRTKGMRDAPADVAFGSKVTIKHHNTQGGYLHSHAHMYPTGSKQQQITLYPHRDSNNDWLIENTTYPDGGVGPSGFDAMPPIWIENGSVIKLFHAPTDRRLHSHDVRPPVSEADWQNEVSAYGYKGFAGDANDYFRVEIIKEDSYGAVAKQRVRTIETKFRLIHTMTGCALFSHKVKLPEWGFEQQEVTCAKQGTLPNSIWYIESNSHPQLGPDAERVNYRRPGFFGKFWELNKVMWKTNAGLVESHSWDSRPDSWPILRRGINFWGKNHRQIYLIGNPLIWWSTTAVIALYAAFKGLALLRWQRGYTDYNVENFRRFDFEIGVAVLGWFFHYAPFFLMQRQLFLHHYLPALYFAVIALCQTFDFVAFRVPSFGLRSRPAIGWIMAVSFLALSGAVFQLFAPLAYGNKWTKSECRQVKLFSTWDWDCNNFLDSYDHYDRVGPSQGSAHPTGAPKPLKAGPPPAEAVFPPPAAGPPPPAEAPPNDPSPEVVSLESEHATTGAAISNSVPDTEEVVEYRDQDGNLLDEEQVAALEGKVKFETKYETKYRVLDEAGNVVEVRDEAEEAAPEDQLEDPDVEVETVIVEKEYDEEDDHPNTAEEVVEEMLVAVPEVEAKADTT